MEEKDRTLGLRSVVSISVGLVIATSCLVSLGQGAGSIGVVFIGAMVIACLLNMTTVASLSELNALMPNTTGGLAQYTLACLGPFPTLISMVGGYVCKDPGSGSISSGRFYADYGNHWNVWTGNRCDGAAAIQYGCRLERSGIHGGSGILAVHRSRICHSGIQKCEKCETQCTTWYDDRSGTDLSGAVHYGAWFSQLYTMG